MAFHKLRSLLESKWGQTFLAATLFALLTLFIFRNYLHGEFLVGSDAMGPLADLEMMKLDHSYFSSWRPITSLGYLNYPSPTLSAIYYLSMEVLGLDPSTLWKGLIVLSFFLAGFLMYVCAYRITGNYLAGLIAGLAYLFNQVFLSQVTEMHHFFIMGYALFPLLFLALYLVLKENKLWATLALPPLALLYGTMGAPHTILITGIFLILFTLSYAGLQFRKSKLTMVSALVVGAVAIFLVILPSVQMKFSGGGFSFWNLHYTIEEAKIYSSYTIYHSFIMASTENTFIFSSPIGQWTILGFLWPLGWVVAVIVPLVAFTSFKVARYKQLLISLLVPVLAFIIIAAGPNPPYGQAFSLAFQYVPFMDSIRVYSRFHLLTGFAIALMIAIVIAHFDEVKAGTSFSNGVWGKIKGTAFSSKKVLSCLIIFCLVFPSSAILSGEIRSFDLPTAYSDPYQWLREQDGDFRVLSLPFQHLYYTQDLERFDNYTGTMTLDVGMYSPLISHKPLAFGVETQDYWSFVGSTLENKEYGYKEIAGLLGGTSSVRYIVSQVQTDPNETILFSSLNNTYQAAEFNEGGSILEIGQWEPRVHGLGKLCLATGGKAGIPVINGLGLTNSATDGIVLMSQLDNETSREELLSHANMLIVFDGDLAELAAEARLWKEGQVINLAGFGDVHTNDSRYSWISSSQDYVSGYTVQPTIITSGKNRLSFALNAQSQDSYDLLIRAMYGPEAGTLNISIDNHVVASVRPYSDYPHAGWIRLSGLQLGASSHQVTIDNDGTGENSLEKLIFAPHSVVMSTMNETTSLLQKYQDKIVYIFSGSQSSQWTPGTYFGWEGDQGVGIANYSTLTPREFSGNVSIVSDSRASSGEAVRVKSGTNATSPLIRDFAPNSLYTAQIRLAADNATGNCIFEVKDEKGKAIASKSLSSDAFGGTEFQNFSLSFLVPQGSGGMRFELNNTGKSPIVLDQIVVHNDLTPHPQLTLNLPLEGNYILGIAGSESNFGSEQQVAIDGVEYTSLMEGKIARFDLNGLEAGNHTADLRAGSLYAMFVSASNASFGSSTSRVSFDRQSDVQYIVNTSSNGPMWLLVSDSYHPLWEAELDGKKLLHVQVNSIVNAFYIPEEGNHTVTVTFHGQDIYGTLLMEMLVSLAICTAALVLLRSWRKKDRFRGK